MKYNTNFFSFFIWKSKISVTRTACDKANACICGLLHLSASQASNAERQNFRYTSWKCLCVSEQKNEAIFYKPQCHPPSKWVGMVPCLPRDTPFACATSASSVGPASVKTPFLKARFTNWLPAPVFLCPRTQNHWSDILLESLIPYLMSSFSFK